MTKKQAVEKYNITRWRLQRLISGEQIYKYNALKKRSWITGEKKPAELEFKKHYEYTERGVLVFTKIGEWYLETNFGVRK
jgi:hypothetical protein